jgi:hypothetical protein
MRVLGGVRVEHVQRLSRPLGQSHEERSKPPHYRAREYRIGINQRMNDIERKRKNFAAPQSLCRHQIEVVDQRGEQEGRL